jgi:hypothetical protein
MIVAGGIAGGVNHALKQPLADSFRINLIRKESKALERDHPYLADDDLYDENGLCQTGLQRFDQVRAGLPAAY